MQHKVRLSYDRKIIQRAALCFWWRCVGWRFVLALIICATSLGLGLMRDHAHVFIRDMTIVALALGILFPLVLYVVHYRNGMKKLAAMKPPEAELLLTDEAISFTSNLGEKELPWKSITALWRFSDVWLVLLSRAQFATLPLSCLPQDARDFLVSHVTAAGGKVS